MLKLLQVSEELILKNKGENMWERRVGAWLGGEAMISE